MTDKQIIIDGVDVSGCKHYKHNDKNSGWSGCTSKDEEHIHSANPLCCEKKDCLHKQLKRKEQECEELKKQVDITQMFLDACNNSCEHYKQTLTEIKEIAEIRKDDINDWLAKEILQKISEVEDG